jgi:hypothetical protein
MNEAHDIGTHNKFKESRKTVECLLFFLFWDSVSSYIPDWPWTQQSSCLSHSCAEIIGMHHCAQQNCFCLFYFLLKLSWGRLESQVLSVTSCSIHTSFLGQEALPLAWAAPCYLKLKDILYFIYLFIKILHILYIYVLPNRKIQPISNDKCCHFSSKK